MELTAQEELAARVIGIETMKYLRQEEVLKKIILATDSEALRALEKIRCILEDEALDDPQRFRQIEAVVNVLETSGIGTVCHDW